MLNKKDNFDFFSETDPLKIAVDTIADAIVRLRIREREGSSVQNVPIPIGSNNLPYTSSSSFPHTSPSSPSHSSSNNLPYVSPNNLPYASHSSPSHSNPNNSKVAAAGLMRTVGQDGETPRSDEEKCFINKNGE
jgi:hypothetical protein